MKAATKQKSCRRGHPLQERHLEDGLCDGCFRKIDVGNGCAKCDFNLCMQCMARDVEFDTRALLIFSFKTCAKVAHAKQGRFALPQLLKELTDDRLQKRLGGSLG